MTLELTAEEAIIVRHALALRRNQLSGALIDGSFFQRTTIGDAAQARLAIKTQDRLIEVIDSETT